MKDLALHILDLVQNSISAEATLIQVNVLEDTRRNLFAIVVADNGKGMAADVLEQVRDPFYTSRTTRKVGMGIPLFEQTVRQSGGGIEISSAPGKGTRVEAKMIHDHIDRPAMGDISGVMSMLAGANPMKDFVYTHEKNENRYIFDTREVKAILEDVPLSELAVIKSMKEMIQENLMALE